MTESPSTAVREAIGKLGPAEAFRTLIDASNARIAQPNLDNGRQLAAERCAIYRELMASWAAEQQEKFQYNRGFAVVALGGTGRDEMTPCSDTDFAFLFDDRIEKNEFLLELQRQMIHSGEFGKRCGFRTETLPFNLEDIPDLEGKQLNAFLDMDPVYDPEGLAESFRERIQATFDPFEHFLHVSNFWRERWGENTGRPEQLDEFDIKNNGLRLFLAGIWSLAGRDFRHSHQIYDELEDPRDLEAYHFLLRIRAYVHLRRGTRRPSPTGNHPEDVLTFDDFASFGEWLGPNAGDEEQLEFANVVRTRILSARRRVNRFAWGVIGGELKRGRRIGSGSGIVYGAGGLIDTSANERTGDVAKSRAALTVLLTSQRYGLPIDPSELDTTFQNAGDWLVPVPELSALFYEMRGSLADSFEFLSQLDGAEDRLFPGYARFETSLDARVIEEQKSLRGALQRQKVRALEKSRNEGLELLDQALHASDLIDSEYDVSVPIEAAMLDADHLAAVKLALKTKRLPLTPEDEAIRNDETRELHERFSSGMSGIPVAEYYEQSFEGCEFSAETLKAARFLVVNRRAFKERAEAGLNDDRQVREFAELCGSEMRLRALFAFTCADRTEWESEVDDPARWFSTRELYVKSRMRFRPESDPTRALVKAGYSPGELDILKDFGKHFFEGIYRHYAIRFGVHLVKQATEPENAVPRLLVIRDGASVILGVAARDQPGLAASISGAFWKNGVVLSQAHFFSARNHGLALDFFHLAPGSPMLGKELIAAIEKAIGDRQFIEPETEEPLPDTVSNLTLREWRARQYCLQAEISGDIEEIGEIVYQLTYKIFRHFNANIFGLRARTGRLRSWISVYHNLPEGLSPEKARRILEEKF